MTTTTLPHAALRNVVLFSAAFDDSKMRVEKRTGPNGQYDVLVVEDLPVFRSGTFRDSMGFQHTWEPLHVDQMIANYSLMKNRGYLVDVPVRKDHAGFLSNRMDETIGYHTDLRSEVRTNPVDGTEQTYLIATLEVSDPGAIDKISRRLWRNVSAEVGTFTANNETEFWPAYQGVAYVDIPAVEGLKSFNNHNGVGKEFSVMLDTDKQEDAVTAPNLPNPTPAPPQAPAPQTPTDTAYHGRANFVFSVNGQQTTDFAAVQAHITGLEAQNASFAAAAAEAKTVNRQAFIKGLAEGATPRILASQIPAIEGYALNLPDEAWGQFVKAHEAMPSLPSVSQHTATQTVGGQQVNPQGNSPVATQSAPLDEVTKLAGIVEHHRISGMAPAKIKETQSYKRLFAVKPDHEILAKIA
jgi:hypothetical protein